MAGRAVMTTRRSSAAMKNAPDVRSNGQARDAGRVLMEMVLLVRGLRRSICRRRGPCYAPSFLSDFGERPSIWGRRTLNLDPGQCANAHRRTHRFPPGGDIELGEAARQVPLDRLLGQEEPGGDLGVAEAGRHEREHLLLARAQPGWVGAGGWS